MYGQTGQYNTICLPPDQIGTCMCSRSSKTVKRYKLKYLYANIYLYAKTSLKY